MASFYKAPSKNYVATTLDGAITDSADTITLTSTANLQFPGVIVVDRENANGTATPNSREVIHYTGISGSDLTGCTRGEEGSTARAHSDGALVEAVFTIEMWNDLRDAINTAFVGNAAGTALLVSSATISTSINVSGASIVGLDTSTADPLTLNSLNITSTASIARVESAQYVGTNIVITSTVSTSRVEYAVGRMALNSNASGAIACDFDAANLFSRSLTANTTISLANWSTGDKGVIRLIQDATGSRTVNWVPGVAGATICWENGSAPTLTTTANKTDAFGFIAVANNRIDGVAIGKGM